MIVSKEETFGPIAPIITFEEYDEAIEIRNDIDLGLTSSVFTSNLDLRHHMAENVETGIVNVNDGSAYWEIRAPFRRSLRQAKRKGATRRKVHYRTDDPDQDGGGRL